MFPMLLLAASLAAPDAAACGRLQALSLPETTILSTEVLSGTFTPPGTSAATPPRPIPVPAACRVVGRIQPAITFEVWLPLDAWNGKFQGVGGGGFAGVISYGAMASALRRGYATASTDTGHSTPGGSWALGHPELVTDFAYRAIHEMTVKAKAVVAAFYGTAARTSYFVGCSTGGRQGLMEAQRFPADYDGIVAGAPANDWTHLMAASLWVASATLKDAAARLPAPELTRSTRRRWRRATRTTASPTGSSATPQPAGSTPAPSLSRRPYRRLPDRVTGGLRQEDLRHPP